MKKIIKYYLNHHVSSIYLSIFQVKILVNYLISKKRRPDTYQIKSVMQNSSYINTFFGYYDKSPFNPSNSDLIIFHANNCKPWKKPEPEKPTSIILYDLNNKIILKEITRTNAWNWQQGSRTFWLNDSEVIYNQFDRQNKLYYSEIYNIKSETYRKNPLPVQDAYKDEYFISISYEALNITRPDYGYRCKKNKDLDLFSQKLLFTDLKSGKIDILCAVKDVLRSTSYSVEKITYPRFNHVSISPDGKRFVFLLRFYHKFELKHYLVLYDLEKNNSEILIEDQMISHYCWLDNNNILLWGVISKKGDYYILNLENQKLKCLDTGLSDGHPSMLDDKNFITDTYPDKSRLRKLLLVNLSTSKKKIIGEFLEPVKYISETRCDLHPHPDPEKQNVHIDRIVNGCRALTIISLKDLK
ncbi:MAG: hypothetical protein APR54_02565 [Candidatus Cloacimonas sp. SDB]|nr:MAG: hypothetical protein APR54_02565 [Candidatus Cloacimonas sp. SDB]